MIDWKARALAAEKEIRRLRKVEHAAWHLLDESTHYVEEKRIEVGAREFKALEKLILKDHP